MGGRSTAFGEYERLELLGSGGNADVHRARAPDGTVVALKTPRVPDRATVDTALFEEFREEAEVWDRLDDHENVVEVHDYGEAHLPWIALEYVPDGNLASALDGLDLAERLAVLSDVCDAVFHAHRFGVSHGDLKPENVLLDRTGAGGLTAKVGDWGLATVLLEHSAAADGVTVAYAAPEQLDPDRFGSPDDRTDIYQLGAIAYELLTGAPPFDAATTTERVAAVLREEPPPPSEVADGHVPASLDRAVAEALSTEQDDRPASVVYLRDAVREARAELADGTASDAAADRSTGGGSADSTRAGPGGRAAGGAASESGAAGTATDTDPEAGAERVAHPDTGARRPGGPDTGVEGAGRTGTRDRPGDGVTAGDDARSGATGASGTAPPDAGDPPSTHDGGSLSFAFSYPFSSGKRTLLVGGLLVLSSLLVVPALAVVGYLGAVVRAIGSGASTLPSVGRFGFRNLLTEGLASSVVVGVPLLLVAALASGSRNGALVLVAFGFGYVLPAIFLRGENPAVYGGSESDNSSTAHSRWQGRIFHANPSH